MTTIEDVEQALSLAKERVKTGRELMDKEFVEMDRMITELKKKPEPCPLEEGEEVVLKHFTSNDLARWRVASDWVSVAEVKMKLVPSPYRDLYGIQIYYGQTDRKSMLGYARELAEICGTKVD